MLIWCNEVKESYMREHNDNPKSSTQFVREYNFYREEDEFFDAKLRRSNFWRVVDIALFLAGIELVYWLVQHGH